jgi:hypothetical protein
MRFTVTLSDKYASGEASQDNCEAHLSFCESIDTLPRTTFTVQKYFVKTTVPIQNCKLIENFTIIRLQRILRCPLKNHKKSTYLNKIISRVEPNNTVL